MTGAGDGFPAGWAVELDRQVRRTDRGRTLIGGAPLRVLRLTEAGARWLDRAAVDGGTVPTTASSRSLARRLVEGGLGVPRPTAPVAFGEADVAVVIPVLDDVDGLRCTLASLRHLGDPRSGVQVIVVDDGSGDADGVRAAAEAGGATVQRLEATAGPAAARNLGWRATDRPVVAFVDAEVEVDGGWLPALLAHLDDPTVAAAAPRIRAHRGDAPGWLGRYETARFPLDLGPAAGPVRPGARVSYVPTAALLVRRDALDAVGGFDEALRCGEDVDLVWRLAEQGIGVRYEPEVVAHHPSRPTPLAALQQRFAYGTSAGALARRHGRMGAPFTATRWSALAALAMLLGRPAVAATVVAGTTVRLVRTLGHLDRPVPEALRLSAFGHVRVATSAAEAVRRTWWPLAALLGWRVRRARPALVAAALVPPLLEWRAVRPDLDPARWLAARLAEDLAYGTGVWVGCFRARSVEALLPRFIDPVAPPNPT